MYAGGYYTVGGARPFLNNSDTSVSSDSDSEVSNDENVSPSPVVPPIPSPQPDTKLVVPETLEYEFINVTPIVMTPHVASSKLVNDNANSRPHYYIHNARPVYEDVVANRPTFLQFYYENAMPDYMKYISIAIVGIINDPTDSDTTGYQWSTGNPPQYVAKPQSWRSVQTGETNGQLIDVKFYSNLDDPAVSQDLPRNETPDFQPVQLPLQRIENGSQPGVSIAHYKLPNLLQDGWNFVAFNLQQGAKLLFFGCPNKKIYRWRTSNLGSGTNIGHRGLLSPAFSYRFARAQGGETQIENPTYAGTFDSSFSDGGSNNFKIPPSFIPDTFLAWSGHGDGQVRLTNDADQDTGGKWNFECRRPACVSYRILPGTTRINVTTNSNWKMTTGLASWPALAVEPFQPGEVDTLSQYPV